jgi:hypothetical protein
MNVLVAVKLDNVEARRCLLLRASYICLLKHESHTLSPTVFAVDGVGATAVTTPFEEPRGARRSFLFEHSEQQRVPHDRQ